ncbi:hypothetical protein [Peribacillus frigoritolerans]|uniref:hypothetical protein n=1 Tax=Peribacillus frigoritolerans TaxID=450367 RepID=UPI003B8B2A26
MTEVIAFGTFTKQNDYIHRKFAYLQWGESNQSLGSFLLLNPGGAGADQLSHLLEGEQVTSHVKLDPTMRQIVKLMERIYDKKELNGRVNLYNLFTLQNTQDSSAIEQFESSCNNGKIEMSELLCSVEELQNNPWICIGWGVNSEARYDNLQTIKKMWMEQIEQSGINFFGKRHPKKVMDYYHICPRIAKKQQEMINELLEIYKEKCDLKPYYQGLVEFMAIAAKPNLISRRIVSHNQFDDDFMELGWSISTSNPEDIVHSFSQIKVKREYKLRGYQYTSGRNGNGIVWAIPTNEVLPEAKDCEVVEDTFLTPPKPDLALDDFMEAIEGDKSPLSYLQAAICLHELHEFGAMWHGILWGQDRILPLDDCEYLYSSSVKEYLDSIEEWTDLKTIPEILSPHFFYSNGYPTIVFYTTNDVGILSLNRYTHTFKNGDYTQEVVREEIGYGQGGIIF